MVIKFSKMFIITLNKIKSFIENKLNLMCVVENKDY